MIAKELARYITDDGGLKAKLLDKYFNWFSGAPTIRMDGDFTPDDLIAIAAHMRQTMLSRYTAEGLGAFNPYENCYLRDVRTTG